MKDRKWYRRRSLYGLLVVALVALAIPIYALAGASSARQKVPVVKYGNTCSFTGVGETVGSATMEKDKAGNITVRYELRGAAPGGYWLWFYADGCGIGFYAGKMKVDSSGQGSKTYVVPASETNGHTDFWAYSCYQPDCNDAERTENVNF